MCNMLRGKPLHRLSLTLSSPPVFQLFSSSAGLFSNLQSFLKHCCDHIVLLLKYLNDPHWGSSYFLLAKIKMVYCKFENICGVRPSNSQIPHNTRKSRLSGARGCPTSAWSCPPRRMILATLWPTAPQGAFSHQWWHTEPWGKGFSGNSNDFTEKFCRFTK